MDHRQTPCPDSDFSGYSDKPAYAPVTGEHKIPWPPPSPLHKHPSTWAVWLVLLVTWFWMVCGIIGLWGILKWLF